MDLTVGLNNFYSLVHCSADGIALKMENLRGKIGNEWSLFLIVIILLVSLWNFNKISMIISSRQSHDEHLLRASLPQTKCRLGLVLLWSKTLLLYEWETMSLWFGASVQLTPKGKLIVHSSLGKVGHVNHQNFCSELVRGVNIRRTIVNTKVCVRCFPILTSYFSNYKIVHCSSDAWYNESF